MCTSTQHQSNLVDSENHGQAFVTGKEEGKKVKRLIIGDFFPYGKKQPSPKAKRFLTNRGEGCDN